MSGHTAGPLEYKPPEGIYLARLVRGGKIVAVFKNDPEPEIAALIAAAPDLLEALKALLQNHCQLVSCGDCGNWDVEAEDEVIRARYIIAKATGK